MVSYSVYLLFFHKNIRRAAGETYLFSNFRLSFGMSDKMVSESYQKNFFKSLLTNKRSRGIIWEIQTVDAEITVMMLPQRARGAESRVKNKSSNGPLRAQSNDHWGRVFCDVLAYVSCRGYVGILPSAQYHAANQGGTADKVLFVLDKTVRSCRGRFCFPRQYRQMYTEVQNYEILSRARDRFGVCRRRQI